MFYIYILNSLVDENRWYVGYTLNPENRLKEHNTGKCIHTSKYKPWRLRSYVFFDNKEMAAAFEKYLKSGSGREFAKRHF